MTESVTWKLDAMEERNAIATFSRPEVEGLLKTAQFFPAIRRSHLAHALKNARIACEELSRE